MSRHGNLPPHPRLPRQPEAPRLVAEHIDLSWLKQRGYEIARTLATLLRVWGCPPGQRQAAALHCRTGTRSSSAPETGAGERQAADHMARRSGITEDRFSAGRESTRRQRKPMSCRRFWAATASRRSLKGPTTIRVSNWAGMPAADNRERSASAEPPSRTPPPGPRSRPARLATGALTTATGAGTAAAGRAQQPRPVPLPVSMRVAVEGAAEGTATPRVALPAPRAQPPGPLIAAGAASRLRAGFGSWRSHHALAPGAAPDGSPRPVCGHVRRAGRPCHRWAAAAASNCPRRAAVVRSAEARRAPRRAGISAGLGQRRHLGRRGIGLVGTHHRPRAEAAGKGDRNRQAAQEDGNQPCNAGAHPAAGGDRRPVIVRHIRSVRHAPPRPAPARRPVPACHRDSTVLRNLVCGNAAPGQQHGLGVLAGDPAAHTGLAGLGPARSWANCISLRSRRRATSLAAQEIPVGAAGPHPDAACWISSSLRALGHFERAVRRHRGGRHGRNVGHHRLGRSGRGLRYWWPDGRARRKQDDRQIDGEHGDQRPDTPPADLHRSSARPLAAAPHSFD